MTVNAVLHITVLSIGAWIDAREQGDGVDLLLGWAVIVFKATLNPLRTGTAEEMVIAEFVVIFSFLDVL